MKLLIVKLLAITVFLSGCVAGGKADRAEAGGSINKAGLGKTCYAQGGSCPVRQALVVGALCFCQTPYGRFSGRVGQ